ncbi:MAG TPA: 2-dehydropantoate 2-reductase [Burkholderiaceae bacterium]|nr:2-dehydropantoate 2-reductase [Burkholderiaceae bacterium]
MKVCVVGAGSIGATIGARLAAAGEQVCLIGRGAHLQAMRSQGLRFVDQVGSRSGVYRLPASAEPSDFGPQDLVVIALKAYSVPAMLPRLAPLLDSGTVVLPALNGLPWWYFYRSHGPYEGMRLRSLDPEGTMDAALDCARVIGCVVHLAAEVLEPGRVQHTAGRRLIIGEPDGSDSVRLHRVESALQAADFQCEVSARIRRDIWSKLIGNLSFNPVAALTGYRMDQICNDAEVLDVIREVLREGIEVAGRLDVTVGITIDQRIDVARQLGAARISMLQDLQQRRPLELAAIVGVVIELAELTGTPVPSTRVLHALVQARAQALGIPV